MAYIVDFCPLGGGGRLTMRSTHARGTDQRWTHGAHKYMRTNNTFLHSCTRWPHLQVVFWTRTHKRTLFYILWPFCICNTHRTNSVITVTVALTHLLVNMKTERTWKISVRWNVALAKQRQRGHCLCMAVKHFSPFFFHHTSSLRTHTHKHTLYG